MAPSPNAIRIMRESDVPVTPVTGVFRYPRWTVVLATAAMLGGGATLVVVGRTMGNPFAYYIAALLFMFLWIYQTMVLARFRGSNWLVRVAERGIYIKFRSYLNHHLPESDPTVAYIPFRDIRLARLVRELQDVQDSDGRGTLRRRRMLVEMDLDDAAPELEAALATERRTEAPGIQRWYGSSAARYRHHPIRMAHGGTLSIEWGAVPTARHFLAMLAVHAPVDASEIVRDYTALGATEPEEGESRLLELAESGQVHDAIRLARSLYGYDLTQATLFVESLAGRAKA
jgi:hypothetical protein